MTKQEKKVKKIYIISSSWHYNEWSIWLITTYNMNWHIYNSMSKMPFPNLDNELTKQKSWTYGILKMSKFKEILSYEKTAM